MVAPKDPKDGTAAPAPASKAGSTTKKVDKPVTYTQEQMNEAKLKATDDANLAAAEALKKFKDDAATAVAAEKKKTSDMTALAVVAAFLALILGAGLGYWLAPKGDTTALQEQVRQLGVRAGTAETALATCRAGATPPATPPAPAPAPTPPAPPASVPAPAPAPVPATGTSGAAPAPVISNTIEIAIGNNGQTPRVTVRQPTGPQSPAPAPQPQGGTAPPAPAGGHSCTFTDANTKKVQNLMVATENELGVAVTTGSACREARGKLEAKYNAAGAKTLSKD